MIEKFLSELKKLAEDKNINTSVFLLHKINSAKKNHLQRNPGDESVMGEIMAGIKIKNLGEMKQELAKKADQYNETKKLSEQKIAEMAADKIRNGSVVFAYEGSKNLVNGLMLAKAKGRKFSVHTAESGKIQPIAGSIKIKKFKDLMINEALKDADIFLFEPEEITKDGKIFVSSQVSAILDSAAKNKVASYGIYNKFSRKEKTKENLQEAGAENISGIITESGILRR